MSKRKTTANRAKKTRPTQNERARDGHEQNTKNENSPTRTRNETNNDREQTERNENSPARTRNETNNDREQTERNENNPTRTRNETNNDREQTERNENSPARTRNETNNDREQTERNENNPTMTRNETNNDREQTERNENTPPLGATRNIRLPSICAERKKDFNASAARSRFGGCRPQTPAANCRTTQNKNGKEKEPLLSALFQRV